MATVGIVEDDQLFGSAVSLALDARGIDVVQMLDPSFNSMDQLRHEIEHLRPAVLLLDLDLGALGHGSDLVAQATALGARVIVVSASRDSLEVGKCFHLGAEGWVPKRSSVDTLHAAIRAALSGQPLLPHEERAELIAEWRSWQHETSQRCASLASLTQREAFVLAQLMLGRTVGQIAASAFLSDRTVRSYVRSVLSKLGTKSQLQAVAVAVEAGWDPPLTGWE